MPGNVTLAEVLSFQGSAPPASGAPPAPAPPPGPAKTVGAKAMAKAGQVRRWVSVNRRGEASILELKNMRVTHQLGVQLRDLRLLDPQLAASYPSAILAREHALVVNLEFIKCIITMENVAITNLEDPNTLAFVEELQRRLAVQAREEAEHEAAVASAAAPWPEPASLVALRTAKAQATSPAALPFELRALEVVLDTVSGYLERLTAELESAAHPALDALTAAITTVTLERVRRIKNRMVRLTTRVETLREVLEKFLEDDSDMHDMNLTAKSLEREALLGRASTRSSAVGTPFDLTLSYSGVEGGSDDVGLSPKTRRSASTASTDSSIVDEQTAVVEMLLEPYFMQVDNTYNKLQTLCEYIDDTEDYINIELDSHRNDLIRLELILSTVTASVALITAVTSLFAMNLELAPGHEGQGPYYQFVAVSVSCSVAAMAIFGGVMWYCRRQRLI